MSPICLLIIKIEILILVHHHNYLVRLTKNWKTSLYPRTDIYIAKKKKKNFEKFMGKTPVPDSLFSKIAGVEAYNFIEKQLQ